MNEELLRLRRKKRDSAQDRVRPLTDDKAFLWVNLAYQAVFYATLYITPV